MSRSMSLERNRVLKLSDLLVTVLLSLVIGVVYHFWNSVYDLFKPLFFQADEIVYGVWFLAPTLAMLLIRKPGVAILAEVAASHVEILFGSEWGLQLVLYCVVQGLAAELIFAVFRYRSYKMGTAALAGMAAALGSFFVDIYYGYVADYTTWMMIFKYVMRLVSSVVLAGYLAYALTKALEATGVTQLLRPVTAKDYEALDHD